MKFITVIFSTFLLSCNLIYAQSDPSGNKQKKDSELFNSLPSTSNCENCFCGLGSGKSHVLQISGAIVSLARSIEDNIQKIQEKYKSETSVKNENDNKFESMSRKVLNQSIADGKIKIKAINDSYMSQSDNNKNEFEFKNESIYRITFYSINKDTLKDVINCYFDSININNNTTKQFLWVFNKDTIYKEDSELKSSIDNSGTKNCRDIENWILRFLSNNNIQLSKPDKSFIEACYSKERMLRDLEKKITPVSDFEKQKYERIFQEALDSLERTK